MSLMITLLIRFMRKIKTDAQNSLFSKNKDKKRKGSKFLFGKKGAK